MKEFKIAEKLKLKLKTLPTKPGVYQYFDKDQKIIYVGKAKNLKNRVSSYFVKTHDSAKTYMLVKRIADIKYIVVDTELDALLLENNLIKKYQPKYNIQLKDDKTYPWICIKNEPFPRVFSTRNVIKDGSKYFGPYPSGRVMHTLLDLIKDLYPLRTCSLDLSDEKIKAKKHKVCLEYHIGNCKGPCEGLESKKDYQQYIEQIEALLKGNLNQVVKMLKGKMSEYADQHLYEQAHQIKQKIASLENYKTKSTVVSPTISSVDVLTHVKDMDFVIFNYLVIHNGSIIHAFTGEVKNTLDESHDRVMSYLIHSMRDKFQSQSKEVLLEHESKEFLGDFQVSVPQRGDKKRLIELSQRNCQYFRMEKRKTEKIVDPERHTTRILNQIQKDFRLSESPVHIECFDNSNFHGTNAVSACVVFKNAKPSKKDYRNYNVKTVVGADDFATMYEVVYRRYRRLIEEEQSLPQLIVIDGGKGQLSSSVDALKDLGIFGKVAIVGIAKKLEEIFFPGDSHPLYIDKRSESLKIIQHLRNEAHRFGITHHRNKRSKNALQNQLEDIKGIGPKAATYLYKAFKSISKIQDADEEALGKIIGKAKAKLVFKHFHS